MTQPRRDLLWLVAASALLVIGFAAWWRMPLVRQVAYAADLPILALWFSSAGLVAGIAWCLTRASSDRWTPVIATGTLAATAPLSMVPLISATGVGNVARLGLTLASLAVLPLALRLAGEIARPQLADAVRWLAVVCVGVAVIAVAGISSDPGFGYLSPPVDGFLWTARWILLAIATLVPGVLAAWAALQHPAIPSADRAPLIDAAILAGASGLPVVTGLALVSASAWPTLVIPVAVALATAAVLGRLAIRPLAHLASMAASQRDLVIAASDSERTRLASALHDGPLGDVALLVQRLDATGDVENATLARTIADELRDVGNDLRLPVVEDLGVGAGLEWLVERLGRTAGTSIELVVDEVGRPPAEVEGAVYRIAQEALVNAIRHGAPPIELRYESRPSAIRLMVADHGPGIEPDAPARAVRQGRLGLLMMRHRAEAAGTALSFEAGPEGDGTIVELRWPRTAS